MCMLEATITLQREKIVQSQEKNHRKTSCYLETMQSATCPPTTPILSETI